MMMMMIKIIINSSSGSRAVSMRTDGAMDRQTDMAKLIVAFRSFANAPNKSTNLRKHLFLTRHSIRKVKFMLLCDICRYSVDKSGAGTD